MRTLFCAVIVSLLAAPVDAQIVPVWRIVTDVTASICPAMQQGGIDVATAQAEAFHYRIIDQSPLGDGGDPADRFVAMRGRHSEDLLLLVDGEAAWCALSLAQSTPQSVFEAADPHLAAMGLRRSDVAEEGRISWQGKAGSASTFTLPAPRRGTALMFRFSGTSGGEPER